MPFDLEGAVEARERNEALTPYDTGEMLEPKPWPIGRYSDDHENLGFGLVDFDDAESHTVLTVFAHPGALSTDDDETTVLNIDWCQVGKLRINVNEGHAITFNENGEQI